jgi:lysine biosynthesis protein LysW
MIEFKCPVCGQMTSIHEESVSLGAEVLCRECGAILLIDKVEPLVLTELDLTDD